MLIFILLCLVFSSSGEKFNIIKRVKKNFSQIYGHVATALKEFAYEPPTPDKIRYFLFTRMNPNNSFKINRSNPTPLANANVRIVFLIYGWIEKAHIPWYKDLKNAFLSRDDEEYYVVQVDWSDIANQIYLVSSWNTKYVGHIIGEFLVKLHHSYSVPLKNILLVGLSLGGQVAGFVGKKVKELTGRKLARIVALDPVGPLFFSRLKAERLNKNDAEVVQVIHTNGGILGFKSPCGTIDFFVNGGSVQPGCPKIASSSRGSFTARLTCHHFRSIQYFIEAVRDTSKFLAKKCCSCSRFRVHLCGGVRVAMGDLSTRQSGKFYVKTNSKKPFYRENEIIELPID